MKVTYLVHDCFLLEWGGRVLLFDYPEPRFRPSGMDALVRQAVTGAYCVFFISHSHPDHCSLDLLDLSPWCKEAHYVFSDDVPDMLPEFHPDTLPGSCAVVEPDWTCEVNGMHVRALESTDLGVGFLISWQGRRVWFSGDAAHWDWPVLDQASRHFGREQFDAILDVLAAAPLHLALANADPRLENFSGACALLKRANPAYFVPMHAFGDPRRLRLFHETARRDHGRTADTCFCYETIGDSWSIPD
ncbi:MBL fold metallo-hydrolase [Megalodesulfovibrio paquesii]